jgi:hypothetical protein
MVWSDNALSALHVGDDGCERRFFDRTALPNFANGGADFDDPRSLRLAGPRAFYAGMRVTF